MDKEKELIDAAGRGDEVRVQQLLAEGVNVNAADHGWTALHNAARNGHTGTVQALLTAGAPVDSRSTAEHTPLHFAAEKGHTGTVQALLAAGADINARDCNNQTPLHFAAKYGHPECVRILLKAGAKTFIRDSMNDNTAEEITKQEDVQQVFQLFKDLQPKVVDDLLTIDLSGKGLTSVPAEVFDATNIECLDLTNNRLTSIPEEIGQLQKLQALYLGRNLLTQLPQAITTLPNLQDINLSYNRLTSIPEEIGQLQKLRELELDNNLLEQLPQVITTLPNLQDINLSYNRLTSIPEEIGQLQELRELKLDKNLLTQLPQAITTLPNLQHINVSGNKLETLPDGISRLQLHEFLLRNNRFKEIPEEVCSLLQLKLLDVAGNPLKSLPDKISQLTGLSRLDIDHCQFNEFPRQVLQLEGLDWLFMGNWAGEGKPSPVPEDIGRLKNLQILDVSWNDLVFLPDDVGKLEHLTHLFIAKNRFTSVPEQIMNLPKIYKLDLSDNNISSLPLTLSRLAKLKDMNITGNPLTYPPADVCQKGTATIMDFLRREMKDKEERELRKLFHRFSKSVTESSEVEDLGGALGLTADEMINIQSLKNQTPSSQAYKVLSKWMETDREASLDKLQQELSESGMSQLAEKAQRAKRSADTSDGPPVKRLAIAGPSRESHLEAHQHKEKTRQAEQKPAQMQHHRETQKAMPTRVAAKNLSGQVGFPRETIEDLIKDNYELLSKRLQVEKLIPQFIQKRLLDFADKQVIMSKVTTQSRAEALLQLLSERGTCTPEMFVEILTKGDHQYIVDQLKRTSKQNEPAEGGKKKTKRQHGCQHSDNGTPAKRPKQVDVSQYFDKVVDDVSSDWDNLARKLNFSENQIDGIRRKKEDEERRCREVLRKWKNRNGKAATLQALKKALIKIEQRDVAERLDDSSDSSESSDD